jgi:hypothetical protein
MRNDRLKTRQSTKAPRVEWERSRRPIAMAIDDVGRRR